MVTDSTLEQDRDRIYRETVRRFLVLQLVIEVRNDGVYLQLKPIQRSARRIPFQEIDKAYVGTYSAGRYGGWHWGLRWSPGGSTVYRLRGNRGVELVLTDGTRIFIGTQQPPELRAAITEATDTEIKQE